MSLKGSVKDLRRVDFSVCSVLTYSLDGVVTSKLLTCNWKLEVKFVNWIPYSSCVFSKLKSFHHSQVLKEFVCFLPVVNSLIFFNKYLMHLAYFFG